MEVLLLLSSFLLQANDMHDERLCTVCDMNFLCRDVFVMC